MSEPFSDVWISCFGQLIKTTHFGHSASCSDIPPVRRSLSDRTNKIVDPRVSQHAEFDSVIRFHIPPPVVEILRVTHWGY